MGLKREQKTLELIEAEEEVKKKKAESAIEKKARSRLVKEQGEERRGWKRQREGKWCGLLEKTRSQ